MDVQAPQQPASMPVIRCRQPADSLAADLPMEVVLYIFQLATEEEDPFKRQKGRIAVGKVCYQWWNATPRWHPEYAIKSVNQAKRLAASLKEAGAGDKVTSLTLQVDADWRGPTGEVYLYKVCPAVKRLYLRFEGGRVSDGANILFSVLRYLDRVEHIVLQGALALTSERLGSLLRRWKSPRSLKIDTFIHELFQRFPLRHGASLHHLDVPADPNLLSSLAPRGADQPTIRSLRIGRNTHRNALPSSSLDPALLAFAPHLHHFSALDGWAPSSTFPSVVASMTSLERLELAHTFDVGTSIHSISNITILPTLLELRVLKIVVPPFPFPCNSMPLKTILDMLRLAPPKLSLVKVPSSFTVVWTTAETLELYRVAEEVKVTVVLY